MTPGCHYYGLGDDSPVFCSGQLLAGRYRILRFIGRGGMGEVYEAEDLELGARVAVKTLLPHIAADPESIARFKHEIQLSRSISHPNVCRVFDLARTDDGSNQGIYFLTMQFVDGESLEARLEREGPLSPEEALPILEQIAAALDAAHQAAVVHRDVKPSNVMLSRAEGNLRVLVTDFGLARSAALLDSQDETHTRTAPGRIRGTRGYIAPEVLRGAEAGPAADIYAFGVTAYRMLAGAVPASGSASIPGGDPAWAEAFRRALNSDPSRRFASAGEFVRALSSGPPVRTRGSRFRIAVAAVSLAIAGWFASRPLVEPRPPAAAREFYNVGAAHLEAAAYFAATKAFDRAVSIYPRYSLAHARLAEAWMELEIPEEAGVEMLRARRNQSGLSAIDRLRLDAIDATITRDFPLAISRYEQMLRKRGPDTDEIYLDIGRVQEKASRIPDALQSYKAACDAAPGNPAAWMRRAALDARSSQQPREADEEFRKAEELYQITSNLEGVTELLYQKSVVANNRNQFDVAAGYAQKVIETAQMTGNVHQQIRGKLQLASAAFMTGDAAQAESLAREAIATAGTNHIDSLAVRGLLVLGNAYLRKLDFAGAERHYNMALDLARRNGARGLEAQSQLSLASLHSREARHDDAVREARAAFDFYSPSGFARESLQCLTLIGRAQRDRGDAAVLETFRAALAIAEKTQDSYQMAIANESLGSLLKEQERLPEALAHYRKALELAVGAEQTAWLLFAVGDTLWMLGRFDEAGAAFDRLDAAGAKFPDIKLNVATARAEIALARGRFADASAWCRAALADARQESDRTALNVILGLAQLRSGRTPDALRTLRLAAASSEEIGVVSLRLPSQSALAEALFASGDRAAASDLLRRLDPSLARRPLSRWQLHAVAARAGGPEARAHAATAVQILQAIRRDWGETTFASYLARPDVQALWRPVSNLAGLRAGKGEPK